MNGHVKSCLRAGCWLILSWNFAWATDLLIKSIKLDSPSHVTINYNPSAGASYTLLQGHSVLAINTPVATNSSASGSGLFSQNIAPTDRESFFRIVASAPLTSINETSPRNGESDVSVNRETIVRFSAPLSANTLITTTNFYAGFGGRRLLTRVELSSDRRTASLFYLEPIPGNTRIYAVFDGTGIRDELGRPIDADGDGSFGGSNLIAFDTLGSTPNNGTAMIGRVFASELVPDPKGTTNTMNRPLAGVTITVDGAEETLRATTDVLGNFKLSPCPAGPFFVHIDGRTAFVSQYPNGDYYPSVGKKWEAAPGRTDNLAGGTGEIYLPLVVTGTLQPVSATADTTITFPPSVIASNPALAGVSVMVPANALFSSDGTRGGKVGIAPVSPDRLPGRLPAGLEFPLVITVQTDGGLNFDRPAPICFPNLPDPGTGKPLAPGEKNYLYSFNHKKGEWEAIGSMTVSADGKFICTDPGVGILQPGWHGSGPPPSGPPPPPPWKGICCPGGPPPNGNLAKCRERCARNFGLCLLACGPPSLGCGAFLPLCGFTCGFVCSLQYGFCLRDCKEDNCPNTSPARGGAQLSGQPPIDQKVQEIASIAQEISALAYPFEIKGEPIPAEIQLRIDRLNQDANTLAGGDAIDYMRKKAAEMERVIVQNGELDGEAPDYPINYVAEIKGPSGLLILRGKTAARGYYQLFVPRGATIISVRFFDNISKTIGISYPNFRPEAAYVLPRVEMIPLLPSQRDFDSDGASDFVEGVLGTNPAVADTDGDGIPDGVEIDNGTNPLDGLAVSTGVIATANTPGTAVDICAINNLAVVADSEAGISVFNVSAGLNPIRIAQVDTPGTAIAVACSGNLVAVADGTEGLQIVDISDPPAARIVRHIPIDALGGGSAQAVASAANLAFVGTTQGSVSMVGIDTGVLLQRIDLGAAINDLSVEGTTLYAYAGGKLWVFPFLFGPMDKRGSVDIPNAGGILRPRLFVGNGIAYVVHSSFNSGGYHTFDVSDPDAPKLIAEGNTTQLSWIQLVPNGSGTALAVRGVNPRLDGTSDVSLYDVSDSTKNDVFLTTFATPGFARAASIYNGLGYVADDKSGLQVLNYLAYDNKKQPPSGELKISATNGTVTGGAFVVLRAEVKDDVQVRNVEFFVDGQRIAVDGNFPFETVYRVPTNLLGNKLTFSVGIFDTGGNTTSVTNSPLTVVPDNQPPGITVDAPANNQKFFQGDDVPIKVTAIDNVGIGQVTFQLNGTLVPVRRLSFFEWAIDLPELPTGTNSLTATASDLAGLSATSKPIRFIVLKEAISREVSTFNFGPKDRQDAVSREVSAFNLGPKDLVDAISREVSTFNFGPEDLVNAVSHEISTFNFGPVDRPEANSREVSVENKLPAAAATRRINGTLRAQAK